jgi:hypothetical protein
VMGERPVKAVEVDNSATNLTTTTIAITTIDGADIPKRLMFGFASLGLSHSMEGSFVHTLERFVSLMCFFAFCATYFFTKRHTDTPTHHADGYICHFRMENSVLWTERRLLYSDYRTGTHWIPISQARFFIY